MIHNSEILLTELEIIFHSLRLQTVYNDSRDLSIYHNERISVYSPRKHQSTKIAKPSDSFILRGFVKIVSALKTSSLINVLL